MSTSAVKAYERHRTSLRERQATVRRLQKQWVDGSEMTPEQLALVQPALRSETRARHPEWFGEAAA